jgi:hypothetical protein
VIAVAVVSQSTTTDDLMFGNIAVVTELIPDKGVLN